jgi:hypothetical protein
MVRLFLPMKSLTFKNVVSILASNMSTLLAAIIVGQMVLFGASLIGFWLILHGLLCSASLMFTLALQVHSQIILMQKFVWIHMCRVEKI